MVRRVCGLSESSKPRSSRLKKAETSSCSAPPPRCPLVNSPTSGDSYSAPALLFRSCLVPDKDSALKLTYSPHPHRSRSHEDNIGRDGAECLARDCDSSSHVLSAQ